MHKLGWMFVVPSIDASTVDQFARGYVLEYNWYRIIMLLCTLLSTGQKIINPSFETSNLKLD